MKRLLVSTFVCGSLTLFSSQAMAANLTIDNFSAVSGDPSTYATCQAFLGGTFNNTCLAVGGSGVMPPVNTSASSSESGLPTSSVLGGSRQVALNYQGPVDGFTTLEINGPLALPTGTTNQLVLANGGAVSSTAEVTWNGGGNGLGSFSAYDQFQVTVASDNADPFSMSLTVNGTLSVNKSISSNPTAPISFMFCEFLGNCADTNPDLSFFNSVSSLIMTLSGGGGYDANIDLIQAIERPAPPMPDVPEPSFGLASLIVFVLGGGMIKWRKS